MAKRKDPATVSLGRRGGKAAAGAGLRARYAAMTKDERRALAQKAAKARWAKEESQGVTRTAVVIITVALVIVLSLVYVGDTATYSKKTTFWAVSLSQQQLADLVTTLLELIRKANETEEGKGERRAARAQLIIGHSYDHVRLEGDFDLRALAGRTGTAYRAEFSYFSLLDEVPISRVSLDLTDLYRTLLIEGNDPVQVDAIFAFVAQNIRNKETWFSGPGFRVPVALILVLSALACISVKDVSFNSSSPNRRRLLAVVLFALAVIVLFELFGPWFPGTAVYVGDSSWWNRNTAPLTALGLALSLIGILQAAYLSRRRKSDGVPPTLEKEA